jgi:hypothetical protein
MKKKKGGVFSNISNKLAYTLIVILSLILLAIGVIAYGGTAPATVGHTTGEIAWPTCSSGQYLTVSGGAVVCTAPAAPASLGISWIKTSRGGADSWTGTNARWVYIDTGDTSAKTLRFETYIDASGAATYQMRVLTNSAASVGGNLIMQRNWVDSSVLATQYQMDGDIGSTSDRYVILELICVSGNCATAYYGLEVTKFL